MSRPADPEAMFAVSSLVGIVRRLADHLDDTARRLHAGDHLTVAERGLLLMLRQGGPQSIPQLAARREASRQYVQQTLGPLVERGLVAWRDNPRHRRSKLAVLTEAGTQATRRVMGREGDLLRTLADCDTPARVREAAALLRAFDAALRDTPPLLSASAEA